MLRVAVTALGFAAYTRDSGNAGFRVKREMKTRAAAALPLWGRRVMAGNGLGVEKGGQNAALLAAALLFKLARSGRDHSHHFFAV